MQFILLYYVVHISMVHLYILDSFKKLVYSYIHDMHKTYFIYTYIHVILLLLILGI